MDTFIPPPTAHLPPIKTLLSSSPSTHLPGISTKTLHENLDYLQTIYNPPVRGSKRRRRDAITTHFSQASESASTPFGKQALSDLRADPFERSYALRWLSALIRGVESGTLADVLSTQSDPSDTSAGIDGVLDVFVRDASALLAVCSGASAAGTVVREFEFEVDLGSSASLPSTSASTSTPFQPTLLPSLHFDKDRIQITLTDVPLENSSNTISSIPNSSSTPLEFSDQSTKLELKKDYFASVGAQTWGGACVLAEEIAARPDVFFPPSFFLRLPSDTAKNQQPTTSTKKRKYRILELGAGTGLVTLAAGKVAEMLLESTKVKTSGTQREGFIEPGDIEVEIVTTDYYPAVLDNLKRNVEMNFSSTNLSTYPSTLTQTHPLVRVSIHIHPLDWSTFVPSNLSSLTAPDKSATEQTERSSPLAEKFDLVLGADIIYEPLHAKWIRRAVEGLMRHPSFTSNPPGLDLSSSSPSAPTSSSHATRTGTDSGSIPLTLTLPAFHLVIPLRKSFAAESGTVERVWSWGRKQEGLWVKEAAGNEDKTELVILSKEIITCDAESGREDETVKYAYYVIGWGFPA